VYSIYDKFLDIVMELVQFKEELRDEFNSNAMDIIQRALAIDITLDKFTRTLEHQYPFEAIHVSKPNARTLAYEVYLHGTSSYSLGIIRHLANIHWKFTLSLLELTFGTTFDLLGYASNKSLNAKSKISHLRHSSSLNEDCLTRSSSRKPKN
jgi:hypothetical protein